MTQTITYNPLAPVVERFSNGLTVAFEYLPYVHSASLGIWIKTGSAYERAEHAGIAHFLEHLFFKGTDTRSAREIMDTIEGKGGQLNAFTSREYTCLYAKTLDTHMLDAVEVLGDILKHSTFHDFEKERNVILEEIASIQDVPEEYVHDVLTRKFWPGHAMGRPIGGFHDTVSRTEPDDVRAYLDTWYRPSNMVISLVGRFDPDTVIDRLREEFEILPSRPLEAAPDTPIAQAGVDVIDRAIAQNHLTFAFPGTGLSDERRFVFDVLSNLVGGGSTSRLFDRIREREGLAYAIYSYHSAYSRTGMLGVYAAIAPENLDKTLRLAREELHRLRDEPVPEVELESNREQLKGGLMISLESTFNRMGRMARSLLFHGRIVTLEEVLDRIDAVDATDVQSLAQDIFDAEKCAMAVLGPARNGVELPV